MMNGNESILWIWLLFGVFVALLIGRFIRWFDQPGEPVKREGRTDVIDLDHGGRVHIGRAGQFVWIDFGAASDQKLTAEEAQRISNALSDHGFDALAYGAQQKDS